MFSTKKSFFIFIVIAFVFMVANLLQSIDRQWVYIPGNIKLFIYLALQALTIITITYAIFLVIKKRFGNLSNILNWVREFPVPKGVKIVVLIVLIGNVISIIVAKPKYPFYEVGMFRGVGSFKNVPKTIYNPKYFYFENDSPVILDLRKEGFYFLSQKLDIGYTHEFTFSATFHNKSKKETFDFILDKLKTEGIDTLWVGIHSFNYSTNEVKFDTDLCRAIEINSNADIHYGPIFIPDYQKRKCNGY